MSQFMNLNNHNKSKRSFLKVITASLLSFNFIFLFKENKKSIITKKIGNEYWILSSEDL